jgi:hypothetical protein
VRLLVEGTLRWCRSDSTLLLSVGADDNGAWLSLSAWTVPALAQAEQPFSEFAPRTAGGQLVGGHFGLSLVRELLQAQGGTFELVATKTDDLWVTCHMLREQPDRRKAKRFRTMTQAKLVVPKPVAINVIDVSTTGCQVEAQGDLPVEFKVDGGESIRGRVVRLVSHQGQLRVGIEFDAQLTAAATAALVLGRQPATPGR